jgi:hypothetical protein
MPLMKAFIPRASNRNRQAITPRRFPGAELRQMPVIHFGALPDGAELRQMPVVHSGALPDGTELRQCPIVYGG